MTIDGPSGVGKTTVSSLTGLHLQSLGLQVLVTSTPSGSDLGRLARSHTHELRGIALSCLVAADRYHHDEAVVRPAVEAGTVVVCDRYVPSALVLDVLDGVDPTLIQSIYSTITVPDLAIILTGDPSVCAERAVIRGTYSRLHSRFAAQSCREAQLFDIALGLYS